MVLWPNKPLELQIGYMICIFNFDYMLSVCIYIYIYVYICIYMYIYIYIYTCIILAAYTRHWLANVNGKHYRNHSNLPWLAHYLAFGNQNHFLSLPVGVANTDPHVSTPTHS